MQPAAVGNKEGINVTKNKGSRVAAESGYVNDEKFWTKKIDDVPADQVSAQPSACSLSRLIVSPWNNSYFSTSSSRLSMTEKSKSKQPRSVATRRANLSSENR